MSEPLHILTGVVQKDPRSRRRTILLDEEPWRETSRDALHGIDLPIGTTVRPSDIENALASTEPKAARARALRILESRDRSAGELIQRLLDDGYPSNVAEETAASLQRAAIIDDDRLAEAIVSVLLNRKRYGPRRIRAELMRRRIPQDIADSALDSALAGVDEDDLASAAAQPLAATVREPRRLAQRLVRRGYSRASAARAARIVLERDPPDLT